MKKSSLHRDDVSPAGRAPKEVQNALAKAGGYNPYGEPRYRIVLAQHVYAMRGGEHITWDENASLEDQGGLVMSGTQLKSHIIDSPAFKGAKPLKVMGKSPIFSPSKMQPLRVFVGVEKVNRYCFDGWILQVWRPASHFGTPEFWNSPAFFWKGDSTNNVLGPYPERGDFEIAGERAERNHQGDYKVVQNVWPGIPALMLLEDMIAFYDCERMRNYAADPHTRRLIRVNEVNNRLKAKQAKEHDTRLKMIQDVMKTYMGSSLAAGAMRTKLAEKAGITEHCGN